MTWIGRKPSPQLPFIRLLTAKPGVTVQAYIISNDLYSIDTHWVDKRSTACLKLIRHCPGCARKISRRLRVFIQCVELKTRELSLAELTEEAVYGCRALTEKEPRIKGLIIQLKRRPDYPQGRVVTWFREPLGDHERPYQKPFNVRRALGRMWALELTDAEWEIIEAGGDTKSGPLAQLLPDEPQLLTDDGEVVPPPDPDDIPY